MQGRRDSGSDNAAEVAASDDSMKAEDGDSISSGYAPVVVGASSVASTAWDQASMGSNERVFDASDSWMDMMATGSPQERENGSDTTRASGGDGGRGSVAPSGVGYLPYTKGVGKGTAKKGVRRNLDDRNDDTYHPTSRHRPRPGSTTAI